MSELDTSQFNTIRDELAQVLDRHAVPADQACTLLLLLAAGMYLQLDGVPEGFAGTAQVALEQLRKRLLADTPAQGPCGCGEPSTVCVHFEEAAVWHCRPCYELLLVSLGREPPLSKLNLSTPCPCGAPGERLVGERADGSELWHCAACYARLVARLRR